MIYRPLLLLFGKHHKHEEWNNKHSYRPNEQDSELNPAQKPKRNLGMHALQLRNHRNGTCSRQIQNRKHRTTWVIPQFLVAYQAMMTLMGELFYHNPVKPFEEGLNTHTL